MGKMPALVKLLFSCCLAASLFLFPAVGFADVGNFAGDSDYDYSGGSDYSYSYDDDDDDDDDDRYSVSSTRSNDNDDRSSSGGGVDFDLNGDGETTLLEFFGGIAGFLLFVAIIVAVGIWWDNGHHIGFLSKSPTKRKKTYGTPSYVKEKTWKDTMPDKSAKPKSVSTYTSVDPNFDVDELCEHASNLYVRMQQAWMAKDLEPVRPYFTPAFFAQIEAQVQQKAKAHQTNYVERIEVMDVSPVIWYAASGNDHIILRVQARIVDYTLDDRTGELLSGSRTAEKLMTYEWDLVRASGTLTQAQAGAKAVECPNCGAPLDVNAIAKCSYCGSTITARPDAWAINAIEGVSQRTVG